MTDRRGYFNGLLLAELGDGRHRYAHHRGTATRRCSARARNDAVLARATHVFTKTNDGGIQLVLIKRNDPEQLQLIRQHLAVIARRFAAGDFEDPEHIHGKGMPVLSVLRAAKPGELRSDIAIYRTVARFASSPINGMSSTHYMRGSTHNSPSTAGTHDPETPLVASMVMGRPLCLPNDCPAHSQPLGLDAARQRRR
ncbi:hypothetical protein [Burkholderia cepacia]|uniref:hypothetical protein n=1 Tax=Burkholderia cepacia TaxID=292 RepID=UPI002A3668C4|nr:hypothetical protein [Burkholderia cepacia]